MAQEKAELEVMGVEEEEVKMGDGAAACEEDDDNADTVAVTSEAAGAMWVGW